MRTLILAIGSAIALLCSVSYAHGQKATERYIPLGQSPGVSKKYTYVGTCEAVSPEKRTITAGGHTVKITDATQIWLDRSQLKQPTGTGSVSDLKQGQMVEIKYDDPARPQVAEWIKVQVTSP